MQAITHLIAGVPVSDLDAGIDWYTRFFGRSPDLRVGEEILWDVDEHATLFIEPDAARAGAGRITFAGVALDSLLEHLAAQGIEHEPIETDSDGARYVKIPRSGWECDRVRRASRRRERLTWIGGARGGENVTFAYSSFSQQYTRQDVKGGAAQTVFAGWNSTTGQPINPYPANCGGV